MVQSASASNGGRFNGNGQPWGEVERATLERLARTAPSQHARLMLRERGIVSVLDWLERELVALGGFLRPFLEQCGPVVPGMTTSDSDPGGRAKDGVFVRQARARLRRQGVAAMLDWTQSEVGELRELLSPLCIADEVCDDADRCGIEEDADTPD